MCNLDIIFIPFSEKDTSNIPSSNIYCKIVCPSHAAQMDRCTNKWNNICTVESKLYLNIKAVTYQWFM